MRDGRNVAVVDVRDVSIDEIIRYMVGRKLEEKFPKSGCPWARNCSGGKPERRQAGAGCVLLRPRGGDSGHRGAGGRRAHRDGPGHFGMDKMLSGKVLVDDKPVAISRPLDAIRAGIGFVTEDRKEEGLVLLECGAPASLATWMMSQPGQAQSA